MAIQDCREESALCSIGPWVLVFVVWVFYCWLLRCQVCPVFYICSLWSRFFFFIINFPFSPTRTLEYLNRFSKPEEMILTCYFCRYQTLSMWTNLQVLALVTVLTDMTSVTVKQVLATTCMTSYRFVLCETKRLKQHGTIYIYSSGIQPL